MPRAQTSRRITFWICAALLSAAAPTHAAPDLKQPPLHLLASRMPVNAAPAPQLPAAPVHAIFRIDKSENRNQVHYGARVDEACRPRGTSPVYAYWRMHERGLNATEALLDHEQPAYGIHSQQVLTRSNRGGSVRLRLRAWADRNIAIELFRGPNGCAARAKLNIQQQPAVIQSIYIDIGFLFSVNYAMIHGQRTSDGKAVQEKLRR